MTKAIRLVCRCGNSMDYDRAIDPSIPRQVARIESDLCPKCDTGDRGAETWFDEVGNQLDDKGRIAFAETRDERIEREMSQGTRCTGLCNETGACSC